MTPASLNHIYRLVWNEVTQTFVAVCEHARGRGKRSRAGSAVGAAVLLGALSGAQAQGLPPNALPTQGQIAAGQGSIGQAGNQTTVNQASNKLVINWGSFDIGSGARVQFNQPGSSAIALNRVVGGQPSTILGQLGANGQVWLLNPGGIVFGSSAQVNVGGLVASTLAMTDADFLAGQYRLSGNSQGRILNQGQIQAAGGVVALIAPQVRNEGQITTPGGSTQLTAAEAVTLDFHGDGLIGLTIDRAAFDALVDNAGTLQADGGVVALSARSANALVDQVVNNTGLIQAQSLVARNGRIVLDGGDSGTTHVSGTLDASANDGQGGRITVTGQHIVLDGGATLNAAGATGGGQIHVGGGYQGRDSGIANASTVTADASVRADASATGHGEGGQVVFWSDDTTRFAGQIAVRGGQDGGNGGLAEVSGKRLLAYSGRTDAQASQGRTGDLLLDPSTLTIQAGAATGDITGSTVTVADLEAQNANVLLQATGIITFADLSLNGGNGKLSMANNVSLRVEGCTSGACTTNEGISFVNASNTVEVFGTGSLMFVAGATGTGYLTNIGTLIAHGAGSNPGTLPTHSVTSVGSGTPGAGSITLYGADGITIGGSLTTNGGYVRLWGDSDNMGGGGLTLSAPITSNGGNLYVSAGSGAIDLNSSMTLGAGRLYFKADGSYTNGAKSLSGTLSASGDVDVNTPFTMNAGASILTDGVIRLSSTVNLNTGSGVLTLRGSAIDFTGATLQNLSTASMRLEPADASVNMVLGDASGFASASTLAALPGIKNLTIGRNDGTGTISVPSGGFSFNATGTLELVNRNVVIGTAGDPTSTLTNTTGNITITSDNIGIVQAVTANGGAGKVTLRQQTAANELHLGGGISNASVGQINAATLAVGRADGGNLVFDSDITTSATSVHLMSGNQVLGVNGGVSAANLAITAGQGATISASAFNFTTLAASLGGSTVASSTITSSAASWGLGTVDGLAGLTMQVGSTPTVTLTAANALSLNTPIAFNNTASTLNLRGQTLDASGATVSGQTNASVSFDRPTSGGTLTYGGTSGDVKQATLSKFNNSRNLTVGSTGETVTAVGAVNVAVGNQLTIQGDTLTGLSGANTLTTTAGSLKLLAAQGPLNLDANVSAAATLSLEAGTGQTISGSGTLSADKLAIRAQGGAVTLASATHQVNTLAASAGRLQFKNGKTLTVGSVDGLTGVHATDTVDLRATGGTSDLVLNQVVVADNSSASAVPLLLAAGRNFVNNAGAGALTATGGSWRVYSTTPTADTRGGLDNDFKQYDATTASTVLGTGNGFLYTVAPTITVGLTGTATKVYDGTTTAALTSGHYTQSGALDGDTVVLDLSGASASYDTKNVGTGKTVTATGLALDSASNGSDAVYGYRLSSASASGAIGTVTAKTVNVGSLQAHNKVYDGNTTATLGTIGDAIASDNLGISGTAAFADKNVGTSKTVTLSGLTLTGTDAGNYQLSATGGTLTADITPKTLTVGTASVSNKVYDGNTVATVSSVALTGVVLGDVVTTSASGSFADKNVGDAKVVTVSGVTLSGADAGNYVVNTASTTGTADITPKTLTIAGTTVASKTYDGTTASQLTGVTLGGVVVGDAVQATGQAQFADAFVGTNKPVWIDSLQLLGGDAGNYRLQATHTTGAGTIDPAPSSPAISALTAPPSSGSNGTAQGGSTPSRSSNPTAPAGFTGSGDLLSARQDSSGTDTPGNAAQSALDGSSLLSRDGVVSLALNGPDSQQPENTSVPVFSAPATRPDALKLEGQYLVTDRGSSLLLSPSSDPLSGNPSLSQPPVRNTLATVSVNRDLNVTLRVTLLADGTLVVEVPPQGATLSPESLSAYGLTAAKLTFGLTVKQVRAVVLREASDPEPTEEREARR